jgi:hypothetical protein
MKLIAAGFVLAVAVSFAAGAAFMHVLYGVEALTNPVAKDGFFAAGVQKNAILVGNYSATRTGDENVMWPNSDASKQPAMFGTRRDTSALVVLSNGEIVGSTGLPSNIHPEALEFLMFTPERVYLYTGKAISGMYWVRD